MRITPLDVQSHRFGRRLRGCDPDEVKTFLRMVAEDYESLLRENQTLKDKVRRLESRVEELRADEKLLKDTLTSAQAVTDDLRQAAFKEAEITLSAAEVKAEKVLDAAHRRTARLSEDIREMHGLRRRMAESLRSVIQTHLGLIESLEEPDPTSEQKIAHLTPAPRPVSSDSGAS